MRIVFLGTNGWYSTNEGNTSCVLIDTDDFYIIFDAGDGIYKLDEYVREEKPILIFLSHLHFDHIIGIHTLAKFRFQQKIQFYGAKGTASSLSEVIKHPFTVPFDDLPLNIQVLDSTQKDDFSFPVKYLPLKHSDYCLGYQISIDGKLITYATDTGLCENLYKISENADIFITECSYKIGQEKWGWPHLKPEEAAMVAKKSNCKMLVLTHFDASIFKTKRQRKKACFKARKIFNNTKFATDGLILRF